MKLLLLGPLLVCLIAQFKTEAHPISLEERAVDLVIAKYDKQLKERLKGTGVNPAYMAWVKDDCKVTIKAGTHQPRTFSAMEWFDVNVCTEKVEKICLLRSGCN